MAQYFDAYRIDHVLGFFRIWEIPIHSVHGLLGLGYTYAEASDLVARALTPDMTIEELLTAALAPRRAHLLARLRQRRLTGSSAR